MKSRHYPLAPRIRAARRLDSSERGRVRQTLSDIVGSEHIEDGARLDALNACSHPSRTSSWVLVMPADKKELARVMAACSRLDVPVFVTSSARNWGYGSGTPPFADAVHVSLGRLDAIVDYDDDLGFVRVQPGVTQQQLYEFLEGQGGRFWMDATGASPGCSVIGNLMERGFGHTPLADHAAHACGLEVCLADGTVIHTGFSAFHGATTASCYRWGLGPSLDGLFTQSNFGIVTEATIWLMPKPDCVELFAFNLDSFEEFLGALPALRHLRRNHIIRGALHVGNTTKVLSSLARKAEIEDRFGPLSVPANAKRVARVMQVPAFSGGSALYGSKRQVKMLAREVREQLRGKVRRLLFLGEGRLGYARHLAAGADALLGTGFSRNIELVESVFDMVRGKPTEHPTRSVWWGKRQPMPAAANPDQHGCGLIWVCPLAPCTVDAVASLHALALPVFEAHGFDPILSMTFLNERSIEFIFSIQYDRDAPGQDDRAVACHDALLEACCAHGFYPYRMGNL
ncbi:MAG: FAD-binding oxidoreductase, partial [Myxococcota bacterium]